MLVICDGFLYPKPSRPSNRSGQYLVVEVYGGGGHRGRGSIVILEGREGRGWRTFSPELGKVVVIFEPFHGKGSRGVSTRKPTGGSQSTDMGGSSSVSMGKVLMIGGGRKTYVEVLGREGQFHQHRCLFSDNFYSVQ